MNTNRRNFIKTASAGTLGLSLLPWLDTLGSDPMALPRRTPESQGVASKGISDFLKAVKESGLEWHSFMLVRHGNVVAEGWWKPFEADFKHTLYSLSKSFTSTAIGFLVSEGKISVNDQVIKFFPNDLAASSSDNLKAMKIRHLLTMNTGHHTDSMPDIRANPNQAWVKSFLAKPVEHEPGSFFMYNTGATYMLGAILYQVTGQTLEEYLAPRLFTPLNITGYDWEKSPQGLNTAGYGLRVKTEDIAKFGQLYLQKGKWRGKQLLPESWVEEATSKQTTSQSGDNDWSQGYGYQFWRCKPGFYRGDGAFGQFCMVMPQYDAVLVMTSESSNLQKSMNVAYETLLPAMGNEPLSEKPIELNALKNELSSLTIPPPKVAPASPLAINYLDKVFTASKNPYNINSLSFGFYKDSCVLKINSSEGIIKYEFGWENWKLGEGRPMNVFQVPPRNIIPSKIAGTATWLTDSTLQLNLKFAEAIHGDKLTCLFDGNKVSISLMNSVIEKQKSTDKRSEIVATLQA